MMGKKPHIVIIGAGFAGLFCARGLRGVDAKITLIDRQNHHLFQPFLYQVATGFLSINDVAFPIRQLFRRQPNVDVVMAEVRGVDPDRKVVDTGEHPYTYDYLVIATGSSYSFFGHDAWRERTSTLKTLDDATRLRERILSSFEKAELAQSEEERKQLLTYIVIGGGPTGVEMAGAIADAVNFTFEREFRRLKKEDARIILLEAAPRILGSFDERLSLYAQKMLQKKGVHVLCNHPVQNIDDGKVTAGDREIESDIMIWAAGVEATPVATWLNIPAAKNRTVSVTENLSLVDHPEIFVLGDAAQYMQEGKPLPALASVAKQQGKYMAKALKGELSGKSYQKPFRYRDLGALAIIGRDAAIMQASWIKLSGWFAWVFWGAVHILFLTGFRNRLSVLITWIWTYYLTYGLASRIIMRPKFRAK